MYALNNTLEEHSYTCRLYVCGKQKTSYLIMNVRVNFLKNRVGTCICQQITEFRSIWFNNLLVENLFKFKIIRLCSHAFYSKIMYMYEQKGFLSSHNKCFWILLQLITYKNILL